MPGQRIQRARLITPDQNRRVPPEGLIDDPQFTLARRHRIQPDLGGRRAPGLGRLRHHRFRPHIALRGRIGRRRQRQRDSGGLHSHPRRQIRHRHACFARRYIKMSVESLRNRHARRSAE
jgi:hypothetical protein